jgi:putative transposase
MSFASSSLIPCCAGITNWFIENGPTKKSRGGWPATSQEIENLTLRLARENSPWGYSKIRGALLKLRF